MKILVTGGAGFIGSAVVRHLIEALDYQVICVDKLTYASSLESLYSVTENLKFKFEREDICKISNLLKIFKKYQPDKVLNLAAETHVDRSIDSPGEFIQSNILGTYSLLQASVEYWKSCNTRQKKSFRFHQVSTDEVFGDLNLTDDPSNEFTPYNPSSPYSASKASADHLVRSWHKTFGLPVVISNCSNNYGPFQFPEKLVPLVILKAIEGKSIPVYGGGVQIRDWLYVQDHVNALVEILNYGELGESYNIGGSCEKTNIEVVKTICDTLETLKPNHPQGVSKYTELISFVEDRPSHDLRYAMDNSKVKKELGWEPLETFETGINKTVSWYLENSDWVSSISTNRYKGERLGVLK